MSAGGEDTRNLDKELETPAATPSEGIPINTPTEVSSCSLKDVKQTPIKFTEADYLEDPEEVESIIEKRLPTDKEKALDVDSELDFELKWDDDTDLNDNQGNNDEIDLDAGKELESDLTSIEKDLVSTYKETESNNENETDSLDKEIDSAFVSTEGLDSLNKETNSNFTSVGKDLDSIDKEIDSDFTSTERDLGNVDQEIRNLTSIEIDLGKETGITGTCEDKDLDNQDKRVISNLISKEKDLDSCDKETDTITFESNDLDSQPKEIISNITSTGKDFDTKNGSDLTPVDNLDINTEGASEKALDIVNNDLRHTKTCLEKVNVSDEIDSKIVSDTGMKIGSDNVMDADDVCERTQTETALDESKIVPKDSDDALKTEEKINEDLSLKIVTGLKTSPIESETNSLDEELVYSDAEAPDIEEKELMDEIDAEITAEIKKDKLQSAETPQTSIEQLTVSSKFEDKTTEKKVSVMDVDFNLTKSGNLLKPDLNDTFSSATDLETSIYDINKEHGLDRPDVMIDIPTQDFTDSFDDTDETCEDVNDELDQSRNNINKPDLAETTTEEGTQNLTAPQIIADEMKSEQDIADKINEDTAFDKLDTDEVEKTVEISAGVTVQTESMEVDTDDVSKEIEKPDNVDNAKKKLDPEGISTLEEQVSHADVILKATTEQIEDVIPSSDLVSDVTKEVKDVETSDNLELKELENNTSISHVDDTLQSTSNKDFPSTDNSQFKEDTLDSLVDEAQLSTKEVKNMESSDISKLKDVGDTLESRVDKAEPLTSTKEVKNTESSDSTKLKDVGNTLESHVDKAEPLTSTKEVKNTESSGNSKLKDVGDTLELHVDKADPLTSTKEIKKVESSDKTNKEVEADEAQPSTSNHSELSDEDQEATDSLGLLAESSRVMDDDDEQEQDAEPDDDEDDDDFDQDDESNQMAAEHSEDSNAQQSEADVPREPMDVDETNDAEESREMADTTDMDDVGDARDDGKSNDEKVESNDEKDESNDERDDFQIQIGDVVSQTVVEGAKPDESVEATGEIEKVAEDTNEDKKDEIAEESKVAASVEDKETVKQTAIRSETIAATSKLRQLLLKDSESSSGSSETEKKSPSKTKKLEISRPKNEINIVELEESSSEDVLTDLQLVKKSESSAKDVTSVSIPAGVEVMSAAGEAGGADMRQEAGEVVISGLPKPAPHKPTRLNTDEVSIKTAPAASLVIPETKASKMTDPKASIDVGLEIYSLDSDDEETEVRSKRKSKPTAIELDKARQSNKCINPRCSSDSSVPLVPASMSAALYYAANQQRGGGLCRGCAERFEGRSQKLIEGVKDLTPFLSMDMCMIREEFVEISDSESEDESEVSKDDEIIGEKGAKFLEEHLADIFNGAWKKYDMEERLLAAQAEINVEVGQLEEECKQIDAMLNECQKETDKLRNDLYATFADDRRELPAISIFDTPTNQWSGLEDAVALPVAEAAAPPGRGAKRRAAAEAAPAAKRAAIPLGYAPLQHEHKPEQETKPVPTAEVAAQNDDDNSDISVVKLSVEAAPAGLPPPGVATRPPLRPNMLVFAMRNSFGAWHKVRIIEVQPKVNGQFTMCRVRFEQPKTMTKLLPARCLAYEHPPDVRLTIGTRVVALFKDHRVNAEKKEEGEKKEAYYSGIVAEIPNPVNSFRYLIFFDDGYAQYVQHSVTRLVCECAARVWDEVHPFSRQFVRDYLRAYPERPMVRLHAGQSIKTEWDGKWWVSKVLQVDASLVLVYFEGKKDNKTEWIYRGSTRLAPLYLELQAAERTRARPLPRAQAARRFNMPYVEYTRSDEADKAPAQAQPSQAQIEQEIRRQRAVAKKSSAAPLAPPAAPAPPAPHPAPPPPRDNVTSRVVFYTPKNAIKPNKMVPHTCGPKCKRTDVLALKDLRTYNPLTKPLLSGWERQQVRYRIPAVKAIMYRAPCGRRIRDYRELHRYLQAIDSDMGVDLFDFNPATHCLAEFLLNKCLISKKDLSHGKENVPVPCVNYYDSSLPEFCSYNTERTPTAGVPLNLDPEFLCGCDCTDDCADKSKCACWQMTLEGARTIGLDSDVGYVYKRLPEPLPSGIYECNVRCKCKQTCLNRVAQHPLQLKLQVFKTANRGWGIRALNDVPKGAFLCVYAGNLLTDATANLDGLNEGDEYLAELDYIEVVEQMKEGFEEDIPDDAKKLDEEESESSTMSSSDEEQKQDGDDDFRPAMPAGKYTPSEYSKRLRKREKTKKAKEKEEREMKEREEKQKEKDGDDCITISDDEELREPAHFSATAGMKGKEFVSKYKSVRTLFGKDEACYIMDAKVQGNIGRYLNHSCTPNVFVQNVFVDTHDPRFPWVAFFALSQIRAGTELTWNYNYDVGSVPGKVLYCYCNAPNCRGRLL